MAQPSWLSLCFLDGLFYTHESINHGSGEYVRDGVHTNSIESVWAVMKRGLHGVYHHASPKHLDRIASLLFAANGKRLKGGKEGET